MKISLKTFLDHSNQKYVTMLQCDNIEFFEEYNETKDEAVQTRLGYSIIIETIASAMDKCKKNGENLKFEIKNEIGNYN